MRTFLSALASLLSLSLAAGCAGAAPMRADAGTDAAAIDADSRDAGSDAGPVDAGPPIPAPVIGMFLPDMTTIELRRIDPTTGNSTLMVTIDSVRAFPVNGAAFDDAADILYVAVIVGATEDLVAIDATTDTIVSRMPLDVVLQQLWIDGRRRLFGSPTGSPGATDLVYIDPATGRTSPAGTLPTQVPIGNGTTDGLHGRFYVEGGSDPFDLVAYDESGFAVVDTDTFAGTWLHEIEAGADGRIYGIRVETGASMVAPDLFLGWLDPSTGMRSATASDIAIGSGPLITGASGIDPGLLRYYALYANMGLRVLTIDVGLGRVLYDVPADRIYNDLYVLTPAGPI